MKIYKENELVWVPVYRDEIEPDYDVHKDQEQLPCVELLIPVDALKLFLFDNNMTWDYYEKESCTSDFDGLYEFAKEKILAMRYCK